MTFFYNRRSSHFKYNEATYNVNYEQLFPNLISYCFESTLNKEGHADKSSGCQAIIVCLSVCHVHRSLL